VLSREDRVQCTSEWRLLRWARQMTPHLAYIFGLWCVVPILMFWTLSNCIWHCGLLSQICIHKSNPDIKYIVQQICSSHLILMSEKPDKNKPKRVGKFMNATLVVVVSNWFLFLVNFVMYPKTIIILSMYVCMYVGRRFITQICL
jgi:hypothetical protein